MGFSDTIGSRSRAVKNTYSGRKRPVSVSKDNDDDSNPDSDIEPVSPSYRTDSILSNKDNSNQSGLLSFSIKRRKQFRTSFISSNGLKNILPSSSNSTRLVQTQLSLGSLLSREITCPDCKMTYQPTSQTDTLVHKQFHTRAIEGREWNSNWGTLVSRDPTRKQRYIIKVDPTKPSERKAACDLIDLVNTELNAPPDRGLWKSKRSDNGVVLVYIIDNRAVGVIVVERAFVGHWMNVDTGELLDDCDTFDIILGISRIYVTKKHRRQGISTHLLDAICSNFIYGIKIPKTKVGWSQPSATGGKVASKWAGEPIESSDTNKGNSTNTNLKVRVYLESDEKNIIMD